MVKSTISRTRQLKLHFKRRCFERLGIFLDVHAIIKQIQSNKLKLYKRQSNNKTLWEYTYNEIPLILVYDKSKKQLITVLFKERKSIC